ncbi:MAG: hypothetical protein KIT43_02965 [Bauldia sp.]|nr:hypothetical protein [Bauldia sp.]
MRLNSGRSLALLAVAGLCLAAGGPARAAPEDVTTIVERCEATMNVPPGVCACLGEKASALTELQQRVLAAMLLDDQPLLATLRPQMSIPEATGVATFFVTQTPACAMGR